MSCPSLLPPLCSYSSSWLLQPLLLHQELSPQVSEDPHKQLPWFAGFCLVIWSKSPQVVTHTHRHLPVPLTLPIQATFSLPSCSKQLMRKPWRQRVQGKT